MRKLIVIVCLLSGFNSFSYHVRLFFTNNTPDKFKPLAIINYSKAGVFYEKYIEPEVSVIDSYAQKVKIDKDRSGIDNYILVWFELNDVYSHYITACLASYIALTQSNDIYFTLSQNPEAPYQYLCDHQINESAGE
ncbi:hypothetical protein [Legionella worsleiensis]|uniref:Uncharacterized protein n=1 Tax=Legionella worsleiensis TaxID=45076 RepID=A0A0W1AIG3_9GAMM|nr:hypothetical protein [Legionella worsleiensis]KTD81162.1 hypothetical protein Lwor_0840 [Legionella worsleiensis]STY33137.1 Uncharacterised protein [Legionella worsleiensis]